MTLFEAKCLASSDTHGWIKEILTVSAKQTHLLPGETTAKGTGLVNSVENEDPVVLDSNLTL